MVKRSPRNPYIVGGWVSGSNFYGHADLRHDLLSGPNNYLWVVGTRRVGKTSLLRQLATEAPADYIPIYWDMQGCESAEELAQELYYGMEEQKDRFLDLGQNLAAWRDHDMRQLLRDATGAAARVKKAILLLVDEPEALIPIVENDIAPVQKLRAAMQRPRNLRVILSSTKMLVQLNAPKKDWLTSSFLHGFALRSLAGLNPIESADLIQQTQARNPVVASEEVIRAIQHHTNHHPYLVQWLCYRLYREDRPLRMPTSQDMLLDPMLTSIFQQAFEYLSATERRIMLHLHATGSTSAQELGEALGIGVQDAQGYLYALLRLGYTRLVDDGRRMTIGNSFLKQWLAARASKLPVEGSEIPDSSVQELASIGAQQEKERLLALLKQYRKNLGRLELEAAKHGTAPPLRVSTAIDEHQLKIKELERRLDLFLKE